MPPLALLLLACTALRASAGAAEGAAAAPPGPPACNFSGYIRHPAVTSWEFQLDIPPDKCLGLERGAQLAAVGAVLAGLAANASLDASVFSNSLRTSVFDQVSTAITTLDGRPLFPGGTAPTWRGPAFIRHRRKFSSWPGAGPAGPLAAVAPGAGDLTVKTKDVDLDAFVPLHELLSFPRKSRTCGDARLRRRRRRHRRPRLKWKIENDRYCAQGRPTYEAMYRPVGLWPPGLASLNATDACFPGLPRWLGWDAAPGVELPEYNRRAFSKSVWDIEVAGVPGVANWVASYPTLLDAATGGATAVGCELSLRVKRGCAERVGGEETLRAALDTAVAACEALHEAGWDTGRHGDE